MDDKQAVGAERSRPTLTGTSVNTRWLGSRKGPPPGPDTVMYAAISAGCVQTPARLKLVGPTGSLELRELEFPEIRADRSFA